MAWSTPRTWTSGELVTAANMNTFVRDQQTILKDPMNNTGKLQRNTVAFTTTTAGYTHVVGTDVIVVKAGLVDVLLATATASSTGIWVDVKNMTTESSILVYGSGVSIDGSTATSTGSAKGVIDVQYGSLSFYRAGATCYLIL